MICIILYIIKRFNECKINRYTPKQFPVQCPVKFQKKVFCFFNLLPFIIGKGHRDILQGKNSQGKFQMCLSLIFHKYKIIFKVRNNLENNSAPGDHESSLKIFR